GRRGQKEYLIALNAKDGAELWTAEVGDSGHSNGTPTIDGDLVYAIGRNGDLLCAKTTDGAEVWRKSFSKDFGGKMMSGWGYSESPLIDGDRLLCTPGAQDAMIVALDKKSGEVIWKASATPSDSSPGKKAPKGKNKPRGKTGAGYSSIVISRGAGVKQYVQLTGRGLISVSAEDGKTLWTYNPVANGTANIPTPVIKGDYVFCSSGYGTGSALLKLVADGDGVKAEQVYFLSGKELQNHHGGMILLDDHLYLGHGNNEGFPVCIDLLTGKDAWRPGRGPGTGSAAITYADGHLYFRYQNGIMALIEARPDEYVLKGSFKLATVKGASWPHPVVIGGRLYIRDQDMLHCYNVASQ
ncbi:MAG: PQQ-like beta-propeller repeat protein, partial [Planctomycetales bacterium]